MYQNTEKYALTNCTLLDGTEQMQPRTGMCVCIDGTRIAQVVAGNAPAGWRTIDLGGAYVMPGLINLHVHLPASGQAEKEGERSQEARQTHHVEWVNAPHRCENVRGVRKDRAPERCDDYPYSGRCGGF